MYRESLIKKGDNAVCLFQEVRRNTSVISVRDYYPQPVSEVLLQNLRLAIKYIVFKCYSLAVTRLATVSIWKILSKRELAFK